MNFKEFLNESKMKKSTPRDISLDWEYNSRSKNFIIKVSRFFSKKVSIELLFEITNFKFSPHGASGLSTIDISYNNEKISTIKKITIQYHKGDYFFAYNDYDESAKYISEIVSDILNKGRLRNILLPDFDVPKAEKEKSKKIDNTDAQIIKNSMANGPAVQQRNRQTRRNDGSW